MSLTRLEASLMRMIRGGADPYGYQEMRRAVDNRRVVTTALGRMWRKGLVDMRLEEVTRRWVLSGPTKAGLDALVDYDERRDHYP